MSLGEYLLLAVGSIFWPVLLAIVVLALRTPHPVRLLSAFLAGGLLTTITIGVALVFWLEGTAFVSRSGHTAAAGVDIALGCLSLLAAYVVQGVRLRRYRRRRRRRTTTSSWSERVTGSARLAFFTGVVLDIIPGVLPLVALTNIAASDYADATKVTLVVVFYLIMFSSVEVPILGHVVAPDRTAAVVAGFNNWLDRNGRRLAVWSLALVGVYLVVRGLLKL